MYSVKETASMMGMTEHTIRYYTDKGLVPNVKRDKNNNRLFDGESINWLTGIKCLRDCGMSIDAIKAYCDLCLEGDGTVEDRYNIILEQKAVAEAQLGEARRRLEYLEQKAVGYRKILDHQVPDTMNPGKWPKKPAV